MRPRQLLRWCDGYVSASALQQVASDAVSDGLRHPMLVRLKGVGAGSHAQAGLMRLLSWCDVGGFVSDVPNADHAKHVVLPSQWVALLQGYPHEFKLRVGADCYKLRGSGEDFLRNPVSADIAARHPVLQGKTLDQLSYVIPFTAHTGAGPCSKTKSIVVLSISALLCAGSELVTKFPCATYVKGTTADTNIWEVLLENFQALGDGILDGEIIAPAAHGECWKETVLFLTIS